MKKYWFKNKRFGWGWKPASWQGYLLMILFAGFEIGNAFRLNSITYSNSDFVRPFIIETFFALLLILFISYKTGEKTGWHWNEINK